MDELINTFLQEHKTKKGKGYSKDSINKAKKFLSGYSEFIKADSVEDLCNQEKLEQYFKNTSCSFEVQKKNLSFLSSFLAFYNLNEFRESYLIPQLRISKDVTDKNVIKPKNDINFYLDKLGEMPEESFNEIKNKLLLSICLNHTLRSDILTVKIKNYDKETDNFYEDDVIVYNKMMKVPRKKIQKLNESEVKLANKLLELNKSDYLICNEKNQQYRGSLTQMLYKITANLFGEENKIGVDILRKMVINEKMSGCETANEVIKRSFKVARELNNSPQVIADYYLNLEDPVVDVEINGKKIKAKLSIVKQLI